MIDSPTFQTERDSESSNKVDASKQAIFGCACQDLFMRGLVAIAWSVLLN